MGICGSKPDPVKAAKAAEEKYKLPIDKKNAQKNQDALNDSQSPAKCKND